MTLPRPHVAQMQAYALAEMTPPDGKSLISLSQNEALRGPSPHATAAASQCLQNSALYPDPDWAALRHALGDLHGIDASNILCGAGSLDLIGCLAHAYAGPDRAVLAPRHAYPFFRTVAALANARFDTAAEEKYTVSVDALLAAQQPDTGIVFVANPGNPTGTCITNADLRRLRAGLRPDILLVIDEAYGEFAPQDGPCFNMVSDGNVVILRTFSKAYAMAGLRIGWGLFPPAIAAEVRKTMNPNNVTAASQAAAVAAVADQSYMLETCRQTAELRTDAAERLQAAGFLVIPSLTNFLLIDLGDPQAAQSANAALTADGIFARPQNGADLPHCLRLTIGPAPDLDAALAGLTHWKRNT